MILPGLLYFVVSRKASVLTSVSVAASVPLADAAWRLVRRRPVNTVALLFAAGAAVSVVLALWSGSPVFVLAKGAVVSSLLGCAFAVSAFVGRPLTRTLAVWLGAEEPAAVLSIGGIADLSLVGAGDVIAGDTGPGNALLDAAVHAATGAPCDMGGALARQGSVDAEALAVLLAGEPLYARPFPRSTGREHFDGDYARRLLGEAAFAALALPDLLATLVELTAVTIARSIAPLGARRVVASGGGIRNPLLRERLAARLAPIRLLDADALGIPADAKEALLVALLGYLGGHGLPGTLPLADGTAHTGASAPVVLGALSPPHAAHTLPRTPQDAVPVHRLRVVHRTSLELTGP